MTGEIMGELSIWHWIIVVLFWIIPALLLFRISTRAGKSRLWLILWLLPVGPYIGLWVLAFSRWPALDAPPVR